MIRAISLGAGVQSSTMALMFATGQLEPMPDCAIFADTGAEPEYIYTWLDWLEKQLPFPVYRVMHKDGLLENIKASIAGARFAGAPFFTESEKGRGMLRRQCTREFKIEPITRKLRELVGLAKGQRAPREILVEQYIGISLDEALRQKPSRTHWIRSSWPLVENGMRRLDCLEWMGAHGYPIPQKSACYFCPYHSDQTWLELKREHPGEFEKAIAIDELIRDGVRGTKQKLFLHSSLQPLSEVDYDTAENQLDLFNEDCDGMCGV